MCDIINSVWNWIGANAIALVALAVAVGQGCLMWWQVKKAREGREQEALAEQRYAIYLQLSDLCGYYRAVTLSLDLTARQYDPRKNIEKIEELLGRPTIMKSAELESIYRIVAPVQPSSDHATLLNAAESVRTNLSNELRPELPEIITKVFSENLEKNPSHSGPVPPKP